MKLCIKKLAEKNGITKTKLAQELDVSRQYIYSLYDGSVKSIKIETLEKLCDIFNCTPNDIFTGWEDIFISSKYRPYGEIPEYLGSEDKIKTTGVSSVSYDSSKYITDDDKKLLTLIHEIICNEEFKNLVDQHIKEAIETEKSSKNNDIFDNDEWNQW